MMNGWWDEIQECPLCGLGMGVIREENAPIILRAPEDHLLHLVRHLGVVHGYNYAYPCVVCNQSQLSGWTPMSVHLKERHTYKEFLASLVLKEIGRC